MMKILLSTLIVLLTMGLSNVYAGQNANILSNGEVIAFSGDKEYTQIILKYQSKVYVCYVKYTSFSSCRIVDG
jgi:hypothetical protein